MGAFFGRFCMGIQVRQYPGLFVRKEGLQSYFSRLIRLIVNSAGFYERVRRLINGSSTRHSALSKRSTISLSAFWRSPSAHLCLCRFTVIHRLAYSVVFHHSIAVFSGSGLCYSLCDMWRHPLPLYKSLPVFPFFLLHASFFCLTSRLCSQWMPLLCIVWVIAHYRHLWSLILSVYISDANTNYIHNSCYWILHTLQLFELIHVVVVRVLLLKV